MERELKFPFYAKTAFIIIGLYAAIQMMYIAQSIIVPLLFSLIISVLLHPIVVFLVKKRINRTLAIVITLFITLSIIGIASFFFIMQISSLVDAWPKLAEKFTILIDQAINWLSASLGIRPERIDSWITKTRGEIVNSSSAVIGQTLMTVGNTLVIVFLIPVYIFMFLFYQPLLLEFFRKLFGKNNQSKVTQIISQIKTLIQYYLAGLLIEAMIVSTLNSIALLILGIPYAIIIGIIGGLVNIIPYLGGLLGVALPMIIALVTKDSPVYALYVLGAYYFIQLVDNNYIVPKIVASRVKLNAIVSIVVVLAFGAYWGIPGMFISIPLTAIIKLICDHIDSLKPWGYLLGDSMPSVTPKWRIHLKRKIPVQSN